MSYTDLFSISPNTGFAVTDGPKPYTVQFTTVETYTITPEPGNSLYYAYTVVGGGGSGSSAGASSQGNSGGGGGGVVNGILDNSLDSSTSVVVGNAGESSSFTADGQEYNANAGSNADSSSGSGATSGNNYTGGTCSFSSGGGGGGAGQNGANANDGGVFAGNGGNGGQGLPSIINKAYYGGGGGGAGASPLATGGESGGGNGQKTGGTTSAAVSGAENTGGGGGGGSIPGLGGSGTVLLLISDEPLNMPTISSIDPNNTNVNTTPSATITGYFPRTVESVYIGTLQATITSLSSSSIDVTIPSSNVESNPSVIVNDADRAAVSYKGFNYECFLSGSKILTIDGYKRIETLREGDLVKTLNNGYLPITAIGKNTIYHDTSEERIANKLYRLRKEDFPVLFEDLIITGRHAILMDYSDMIEELKNDATIIDGKGALLAYKDKKSKIFEICGSHTIYHLAVTRGNKKHGIYANGLLVNSGSYKSITKKMELIHFF